jgi:formate hydrogenlyase subunit 6/NADH:ubiquinone oxidoreductase subunit I
VSTNTDGSAARPLLPDSTQLRGRLAVHPTACVVCGEAGCECPAQAQEVVKQMMEDAPMPTAETKAAMQEAREIAASLGVAIPLGGKTE